mmetsp:Transcript_1242/g.4742  ORF Transcript_1242/g.4742 Transcript_1242/m.4742 type:complete len:243 (-) Transcript_1242:1843-2571(-)
MTRIAAPTSSSKSVGKSRFVLAKRATLEVENALCTHDCAMYAWTHRDRRKARRVAAFAGGRRLSFFCVRSEYGTPVSFTGTTPPQNAVSSSSALSPPVSPSMISRSRASSGGAAAAEAPMYPAQETTTSCVALAYTASAACDAASGSAKRVPVATPPDCAEGAGGGCPAHDDARFAHREYTPRCCATYAPACAARTSAFAASAEAASASRSALAAAATALSVFSTIAAAAASSAASPAAASA